MLESHPELLSPPQELFPSLSSVAFLHSGSLGSGVPFPGSWLEPPPRATHKPILSRVRPACTLGPPLLSHLSSLIPLFLFRSYLFIWDMRIPDGFPAPPGLLQTCTVFKSSVLPAHILMEKMPSVSTLQRKLPHTYPVINTLSLYFSRYKGHQTPTSCFKLHVYHLGLRMAA